MRGRGGRRRGKGRRREGLLDRLVGRGDRASRENRPSGRRWGVRTLDVRRDRDLFARLVQDDYDTLLAQRFAASPRVLADLLPQSVTGRAQNGHGLFCDEFGSPLCFPDATFDRVLSVLETGDPNLKAPLVRARRGALIDALSRWLLEGLDRPRLRPVVDGAPLFGIDFLAGIEVDTRDFCTGMVLAGFMDDWHHRRTAMLQHRLTYGGHPFGIGGGEILVVDRERFELCGLDDPGGNVLTDDEMRTLQDVGALCTDRHGTYRYPEYDQVFFRRRAGDGVCDDMALIGVGARHGYDAMLGAFVMDAVDTYDKYLVDIVWGGADTRLAGRLQKAFAERDGRPLVDDEHILNLIHFAAKRNDPPVALSSSHRRLIQYEPGAAVPTLLNHWRFLQGEPVHDIKLGFSRVPAEEFYAAARSRLAAVGLDVPAPRFLRRGDRDRRRQSKKG